VAVLFERMTVAGVGLIGGSLALAAKRAGLVGHVVGLGRGEANLKLARERGIIDEYSHDPATAARGADLLFLSVPVRALAPVLHACAPALAAGAVVTDAGSVKGAVLDAVEGELPAGIAFVGGHPIAGGEQAGAAHADPDIFQAQRCVLTPGAAATPAATAKIRALWEGVGMTVTEMDAGRHDDILARVSHLPHVLAFALMNAIGDDETLSFAGASFQDMTRIAASPTDVWRDIFLANRDAVRAALAEVSAACDDFDRALAAEDEAALVEWIETARARKRRCDDGRA
jgi:prephenate dehydrogenase